ncbi:MAG: GNAT family N-acetyltransferase [Candidatus Dormibacteria bacterium]
MVVGAPPGAARWIGRWHRVWRDQDVFEIGWSVLPPFQGWGIARVAAAHVIAKIALDGRQRSLPAFPAVDNAPSNTICRKVGFKLIDECNFEYQKGTVRRRNDRALNPVMARQLFTYSR